MRAICCAFLSFTALSAHAQTDQPADRTHNDDDNAPFSGAPLSDMVLTPGRLSVTPQLGVMQINSTVGDREETNTASFPTAGVRLDYALARRVAVFGGAYGTHFARPIDGLLKGTLNMSAVLAGAGVAFNLVGSNPEDSLHLVAALGLTTHHFTASLTQKAGGDLAGARRTLPLYKLTAFASVAALQLEWRASRYLSVVPFTTGWRILSVRQRLGAASISFTPKHAWHTSPGLDLWIYLPPSSSHFSLSALATLTGEKPVTTYSVSYTWVWDSAPAAPPIDSAATP